jgi:A/G-specific adenine glycosylase
VIADPERRLLLVQRSTGGLLGGLWGFPGGIARYADSLPCSLEVAVADLIGIEVAVREAIMSFRHAYTHFSITLHAYHCEVSAGTPRPLNCAQVRWTGREEIDRYPFPVTDRRIIRFLEATHPAQQS